MPILKSSYFGISSGVVILSAVAALGSPKVREFIGFSSPTLNEEDKQGQFLYKLSQKLFDSVKQNPQSDLNKNPKDNVIKGLKDKFSGSLENEEDKWENFKSLCETQKTKETKSGKDMVNEYARLCFIDAGDSTKGKLYHWGGVEPEISPNNNESFVKLTKNNNELGSSFKNKYSNANPIDKFDEYHSSNEETTKTIKDAIDRIISLGSTT